METTKTYNPEKHNRRTIRLRDHNYTSPGAYFVTICAHDRECVFGDIENGEMKLNEYGKIAEREWHKTAEIRDNVKLDEYIIMPNHFHGIIWIVDDAVGARRAVPQHRAAPQRRRTPTVEQFGKPVPGSLPTIVRSFKSAVTKLASALIINTAGCEDTPASEQYMSPIETTTQTEETQSGEDDTYSKTEMRDKLAGEIQEMISDKSCTGDWSCESIGYGYKPCGGNNTYLVYSSENLDEEMLTGKEERPQHVILRPPRPKNLRTMTEGRACV